MAKKPPHKLIPVSLPPDWAEAFRRAAKLRGLSLSRWLGEAGRLELPAAQRKKLSTPTGRGRPKKKAKG